MQKIASNLIRKHGLYESFYIADLRILQSKINEWREELPMVQPHYAVKCNPDKQLLKNMILQGLGFDCASKTEIQNVLTCGASVSNIIYAHPVKAISDLKYAVSNSIKYTTFDSLSELEKLKTHAPNLNLVMRLKVDNPTARVQLGLKYGIQKDEYLYLIKAAKLMGLNIVGTSIHIGSFSTDPTVFANGIQYCKEVIESAKQHGYNPYLLDIGGGFTKESFKECADVIRKSIVKYDFNDYKLLAEPGRLFAEEIFTFFTPVIGQRNRDNKNQYWINDGLYGSFNCILYDGQKPNYEVIRNPNLNEYIGDEKVLDSIIWGGTCDSADGLGDVKLPYARNGDYIMIPRFGAYTIAGACDFNGINMTNPKIFYLR